MKNYISLSDLIEIQPGLIFYNKVQNRACIVTHNDGLGLEVEEIDLDPDAGLILNSVRQSLENCARLPDYKKTDYKDYGAGI
jgi:hypothetical protein